MKALNLMIIFGIFIGVCEGGGITYIRWGRTTCPNTCGTSLVYSGRVAGSRFNFAGGAAEYLCLPDQTSHFPTTSGSGGNQARQARLFGTEYETGAIANSLGPLGNFHHNFNVPCAVCATTHKEMKLMIPARNSCPLTWSVEYAGYLMTNSDINGAFHRTQFICVDLFAQVIPGTAANTNGALLYHVRVDSCGPQTFPCGPYDPEKELSCVVCSK